jgi:hypothetical protein
VTGSWSDWGGKGRTSGIDLNSNLSAICTVRDGWVVKVEYFFDHSEALKAAGLSEWSRRGAPASAGEIGCP